LLSFLVGALVFTAIFGILAISLNLQAGETGLLNFGLAGFFGIGAYATGIASLHGVPWPLGMLAGMAVAALAGAAVGALGRTLHAEYWAIATLALAELLRLVALNADSVTGGPDGISSVQPFFAGLSPDARDLAWLALTASVLAACALVARRLGATQFGRVARLVRERQELAASLGHDVVGVKVRVAVIAAPMAALAGSLNTHYLTYIGPGQLEPLMTFLVFTMAVVGGLGSLRGVLLGALLVELLYDAARFLDDVVPISPNTAGSLRIMLVGAILLAFLLLRPQGLLPERLRVVGARR
jgi:branched-chain amino acid transport system permease protein